MAFFLLVGAVSAADTNNVSLKEYSNLDDAADAVSLQNKLEISNEVSISETNIVNSHDDNLGDYPSDSVLSSSNKSNNEDNEIIQASFSAIADEDGASLSSSSDNVVIASSSNDKVVSGSSDESKILSASSKVSTKLSVSDTTYAKSGAVFKVTLSDKSGKALSGQKVSLKVNGKTFSAKTNKKGIASVKADALKIGSYTLSLTYAGNSKYSSSSLSKKVKVSSSVKGKDMTKHYGYTSVYNATFLKNGEPLAHVNVTFKVNGQTCKRTTDKNGVARIGLYLTVGKHVITSVNPYSKEKLSNTITVIKDHSILEHKPAKTYITPKTKYVFSVTLKSKHGKLLPEGRIYFTLKGKTYTAVTGEDGKAKITLPGLSKGTYDIKYNFYGTSMFYESSGSCKLYVTNMPYSFESSKLKMEYNDGSKFAVKLKDSKNNNVSGKKIQFVIDGKTYYRFTNAKGISKISVGDLKPGTYTVKYYHSKYGSKDFASGYNKIVVSKLNATIKAKDLNMKYKDGSQYKVTVKDKSGKYLKDVAVKFTIDGKSSKHRTNSKGVINLPVTQKVGYYVIKTVVDDTYYKSSSVSKHILVDGIKFISKEKYVPVGKTATYSVKAVDGKSNPIKSAKVVFTINGKKYSAKTSSKGVAKVNLGVLSKGDHTIKFTLKSTSGSSKIHVVNKVSLNNVIDASRNVKNYIENNEKLPSTVKIGGVTYSLADYLYLASKAIINLKSGSKDDISVKKIASPSKAGDASYAGNLYDYLSVAKSVVKTADSKGKMPNSVDSKVGNIGYKGLVYAFARVVAFYGDEDVMPNYVVIKDLSESTTSNLNSKNTIKNLASYLAASTNCQVNNAQIKNLVSKLTKGLTSDKAKARAIYNYVRDTISYSFYYDTKYGAVGTLNSGTGNCVDHAHLVVAMCRAAGLPARYVHGTCTFSSGGTYGHVWAQILLGNTWTVADATSTRNSLGNVVNWNSYSYSLHGYYASLDF